MVENHKKKFVVATCIHIGHCNKKESKVLVGFNDCLMIIYDHGLINYDTQKKCSHLNKWPVKGLCGMCLSVWGPLPSYRVLFRVVYIHIYCTLTQGRGGELSQREGWWAAVHKAGSEMPTWLNVHKKLAIFSLENSDNFLPQSPFRGNLFKMTAFCISVRWWKNIGKANLMLGHL